jgi:hypothetical protein
MFLTLEVTPRLGLFGSVPLSFGGSTLVALRPVGIGIGIGNRSCISGVMDRIARRAGIAFGVFRSVHKLGFLDRLASNFGWVFAVAVMRSRVVLSENCVVFIGRFVAGVGMFVVARVCASDPRQTCQHG